MSIINASLRKKWYHAIALVKTAHFTAQGALVPVVERLAASKTKKAFADFKQHLFLALPKLNRVLQKDAENIAAGVYPPEVLFEESLWEHLPRIPLLLSDAFRAARQKKKRKSDHFEGQDLDFLSEVPDYYRRNFHFQKGGYLNQDSARLYDHQVEVLFSGSGHAMRRQIIPQIKEHLNGSLGEGLRFLEIGSGTGSLTRSVALAFPKAQIVCVDLSPHYLKQAQKKLAHFPRMSFVQGCGENLTFKDETFDVVFSCYLFHELPESVRTQVLAEKWRVLKQGGFLGVVDSLQLGDDPELDWALEQFPIDFHEPFYKNYTLRPLEKSLERLELEEIKTELMFLTKIVTAVKRPTESSNG